MATATRSPTTYNTLVTNVVERYLNGRKAEELVFLGTPMLAVLNATKKLSPLPYQLTVRIAESRGNGVDSYSYYDSVSTATTKGTQAGVTTVAQYSAPITISEQEMMELTSPEAIANHIDFVVKKQTSELRDRLGTDIYRGNTANAKNILGLEQALPGYTHDANTGSAATAITDVITNRFQMKQAANTYLGIARTAWTSDDVPGSYWEGNAVDLFASTNQPGFSTGAPNDTLKRWTEAYTLATYDNEMPNLIVSSQPYWQNYEFGLMEKQQVQRATGMAVADANVHFDNIKFKMATWFWDDHCKSYNAISAETVGGFTAYMINTDHCFLHVDSRMNMRLSKERTPLNQHSMTRFLQWRGQLVMDHPRYNVRLFY